MLSFTTMQFRLVAARRSVRNFNRHSCIDVRLVGLPLVLMPQGGQAIQVFSSPDALNDSTCGGTVPHNHTAHTQPLAPAAATDSLPRTETSTAGADGGGSATSGGEVGFGEGEEANPGPSQLWFGMLAPFVPMRFAGAVWYVTHLQESYGAALLCTCPRLLCPALALLALSWMENTLHHWSAESTTDTRGWLSVATVLVLTVGTRARTTAGRRISTPVSSRP